MSSSPYVWGHVATCFCFAFFQRLFRGDDAIKHLLFANQKISTLGAIASQTVERNNVIYSQIADEDIPKVRGKADREIYVFLHWQRVKAGNFLSTGLKYLKANLKGQGKPAVFYLFIPMLFRIPIRLFIFWDTEVFSF